MNLFLDKENIATRVWRVQNSNYQMGIHFFMPLMSFSIIDNKFKKKIDLSTTSEFSREKGTA